MKSFFRLFTLSLASLSAFSFSAFAQTTADSVAEADVSDSYILQEGDTVVITVFGEDELATQDTIDAQGQIRISLLGSITIEGLSLRTAESNIEQAFTEQRYLRDPQVQLRVSTYAERFVSVLGQVRAPHRIKLPDQATDIRLIDAISEAGGVTGIAKTDAIRITRQREDGTEHSFNVNLEDILSKGSSTDSRQPIVLQPGDVVFVPERLF